MAQSTASRALSTPEIISCVLDAVGAERWSLRLETLRACALVNSSWQKEARRRLWESCGTNPIDSYDPTLANLLAITPSRQQEFAKLIKFIFIRRRGHLCTKRRDPLKELFWQGQYLSRLQHLSFPRLEKITLEGPIDAEYSSFQSIPLEHLVGPRLRKLRVDGEGTLTKFIMSDEWIAALTEHSRGLQELSLTCDDPHDCMVSPSTLVSFLNSMSSLTHLRWEMKNSMSKAAFEILVQISTLQVLTLPRILDEWTSDIHKLRSKDCFRSLTQLDCEIYAKTLGELLPLLSGLKRLYTRIQHITVLEDCTKLAVKAIANYTPVALEKLKLTSEVNSTIVAADILTIARAAPNLRGLDLARSRFGYIPESDCGLLVDMDDNFMTTLSILLPKLESLCLASAKTLTSEASLIALGKHCPLLRRCALTAKIDFEQLLQLSKQNRISWPCLKYLEIYNFDHENQGDESFEDDELGLTPEIERPCREILDAMPELREAQMQSHMLESFIEDILIGDAMRSEEIARNWGSSTPGIDV